MTNLHQLQLKLINAPLASAWNIFLSNSRAVPYRTVGRMDCPIIIRGAGVDDKSIQNISDIIT